MDCYSPPSCGCSIGASPSRRRCITVLSAGSSAMSAPSTFGGDLFRGVQLSRVGTPVGTAVRAVLAIRLVSLAALIVVMLAGFPIALRRVVDPQGIVMLAGTLAAAIAALLTIYFSADLSRAHRYCRSLGTAREVEDCLHRLPEGDCTEFGRTRLSGLRRGSAFPARGRARGACGEPKPRHSSWDSLCVDARCAAGRYDPDLVWRMGRTRVYVRLYPRHGQRRSDSGAFALHCVRPVAHLRRRARRTNLGGDARRSFPPRSPPS